MMNFRKSLGVALALGFLGLLSGCLFDSPLTTTASTNLDTRLLGVFEYVEDSTREVNGESVTVTKIHRVASLPKNEDEYTIYYRVSGDGPTKTAQFTGWISRVKEQYYLNVRDDTPGSPTIGKFAFAEFEWIWPADIRTTSLDLKGLETATPFQLREAVRQKLKDGTLTPYEGTRWTRIARIYWDPKNPDPVTTIPSAFENGTTLPYPGL